MNILAATHKKYSDTVYIVELTSSELTALLLLGSYSEIPTKGGYTRKRDELQSGDVINTAFIEKTAEAVRSLRSELADIDKAITQSRTAFTKLQKLIPPTIP